jgi:Tfp pilus assembly protein PilF
MMAYLEKEPEIMPRVKTLVSLLEAYHPTTGAVYALKGNLFDFQTQNDSAQANYRKSLALDGSNQQVWMALLLSDLEEGDNASLKQDAEGAMEFYPNQSEFLFFFGTASQNLKEYEEAIYAFEKIRKIGNAREEIRSQALMALGGIYHDQQQHSKSDARLQEALRLDPKNALALNNYAYFLAQRGERLDEAEKMIAQATALQPGTASFEDTYAWVLYKKGDYEAALMWQEKALKHGQGAELHEHHGDILSKLGQKDKALKAWQKAIEMGATFDLNEKNSQP